MKTPGWVWGLALLGFAAGWALLAPGSATQASEEGARSAQGLSSPLSEARPQASSEARAEETARAPAGANDVDVRYLQAQLRVARARGLLGAAYERTAAGGDFALAPGRLLRSFREKRCGAVRRHEEALAPWREQLGLGGPESGDLCERLLFAYLKERHALPDTLTPAQLWRLLEQVDAAYTRLVADNPRAASDEGFLTATEHYRQVRRGLVGPELDARLFGLSDGLFRLPGEARRIASDARASPEQKLAAWQEVLRQLEDTHTVKLAAVMEPVELARHELRIREAAGPLDAEQRRAVLERNTSPENARRAQEHQQQQQSHQERLAAFNAERERMLSQLAAQGLSPEQLRERMPGIDQHLFTKYHLQ